MLEIPIVVSDATHMRQRDAKDIAREVLERCRRRYQTQALFLFPDGRVRIIDAGGITAHFTMDRDPDSFVGIYSREADAIDISDDILAMERIRT